MDSHAESFDFISRNIQSNSPSQRQEARETVGIEEETP